MTMAPLALFAALALTVFTGVRTEVLHMFDCRRMAQNCEAPSTTGACDDASPYSCACATGYEHPPDLTHVCVAEPVTECTSGDLICDHGTCIVESGAEVCVCDPMHTGDNCDISRADVVCGDATMTVKLTPYEGDNFPGNIYTMGADSCDFTNGTNGVYSRIFYYNFLDCDCVEAGGIYTVKVWVLYNDMLQIKKSTQLLKFQCDMTNSSVLEIPPLEQTAEGGVNEATIKKGPDFVTVEIMDDAGLVQGRPLIVSHKATIRLFLSPAPTLGFIALGITYVLLKPAPQSTLEQYLVKDGCSVGEFNYTKVGALLIEVPFTVFMFFTPGMSTSNNLYIEIGIILCDNAADCEMRTDCGAKRRKRAADNEFEISRAVEVVYGGQQRRNERVPSTNVEHADKMEDCFRKPEIQGIVSGLGLLALCFLLALIIAVYVAWRNNSRRDKSVYDDHSVTSSTQKLDMQIPRPRV